MPITTIGRLYGVKGDTLRKIYKYKLSGYTQWEGMKRTGYADIPYVSFPENCGEYLSIDKTALSSDELFTIVTNKDAHGGPGTLVALLYGTKVSEITAVLEESIPAWRRLKVKEITCDLSSAMMEVVREAFPSADIVIDRFHVQQLFNEAMDEVRIDIRHQVRKEEADMQQMCKERGVDFVPVKYRNGWTPCHIMNSRGRCSNKKAATW